MKDKIQGDSNWFVCECGNEPHIDGFFTCTDDGRVTSPVLDGEWGGALYLCVRCNRIIHGETLEVEGYATNDAKLANDAYDWATY